MTAMPVIHVRVSEADAQRLHEMGKPDGLSQAKVLAALIRYAAARGLTIEPAEARVRETS